MSQPCDCKWADRCTRSTCEGCLQTKGVTIGIPLSFGFDASDLPEMTPELRKHWDEMGVRSAGHREI